MLAVFSAGGKATSNPSSHACFDVERARRGWAVDRQVCCQREEREKERETEMRLSESMHCAQLYNEIRFEIVKKKKKINMWQSMFILWRAATISIFSQS